MHHHTKISHGIIWPRGKQWRFSWTVDSLGSGQCRWGHHPVSRILQSSLSGSEGQPQADDWWWLQGWMAGREPLPVQTNAPVARDDGGHSWCFKHTSGQDMWLSGVSFLWEWPHYPNRPLSCTACSSPCSQSLSVKHAKIIFLGQPISRRCTQLLPPT